MPRERACELRARQRQTAAETFAQVVKSKVTSKQTRKKRGPALPSRAKLRAETECFADSGDWSEASGWHLVELFDWCHVRVYGVASPEFDLKQERLGAYSAANALVTKEFGSVAEAAMFMHWVWRREAGREQWARKTGKARGRLTWRILFAGRGCLGDYRVETARQVAVNGKV